MYHSHIPCMFSLSFLFSSSTRISLRGVRREILGNNLPINIFIPFRKHHIDDSCNLSKVSMIANSVGRSVGQDARYHHVLGIDESSRVRYA